LDVSNLNTRFPQPLRRLGQPSPGFGYWHEATTEWQEQLPAVPVRFSLGIVDQF
jgi:hypothetical protein